MSNFRSEGVTFLLLLGKVVGTASKIQGFFASLRMTNKKVAGSQDDKVSRVSKEKRATAKADPYGMTTNNKQRQRRDETRDFGRDDDFWNGHRGRFHANARFLERV